MNRNVVLFALVAVLVAAAGSAVWFALEPASHTTPTGTDPADAAPPVEPATSDPSRPGEHRQRVHADDASAPAALAVAGIVQADDGTPVAGATVDAFAVPEGGDEPDEDRTTREFLTKAYGKEAAERIVGRSRKARAAVASGDLARTGETIRDNMDMGIELLGDMGTMDALVSMIQTGRNAGLDDAPWTKAGSAATASDGKFRIEGLAAGRVELRARAPGRVKTKQRVTAGDLAVSIRLDRGARLAGVVTCEKEAVVGASVVIKGASATTGAGGRFEFDAAHAPQETIVVSAEGCCAQGQTVSLTLDGPAKDLAIALDPAGAAAGHVASVAGGPIVGARVMQTGAENLFTMGMGMGGGGGRFDVPPAPAVTDAQGAFEVRGLHVGEAKLRIEADGFLGTTVKIDVKRGQTAAVEALLLRESVLAGAVRDEKGAPVTGAKVRVEVPPRDATLGMFASMLGGTFRSAVSDAGGNFEVHGLAEGERKVRVGAAGFLDLEDRVAIPAQAPATRDFVLREGNRLAGTVTGPDGKPFGGAKVYASGKPAAGGASAMLAMMGGGKSEAVATSAADGTWAAEGLQEGPFAVRATADGFLEAETKDVAAGRKDVALQLGAAATIRGRVIGVADAKAVAGASVSRKSGDAPGRTSGRGARGGRGGGGGGFAAMFARGGASVVTDKDGAFEMKGLESGEYELTATMQGFGDSAPVKLSCAAGETVEGVEIPLPPGVTVAGRVVEKATGAPVAGAVVWSGRSDGNPFGGMAMSDLAGGDPQAPPDSIHTRTDGDGRFVLDGVPPGKVGVEVRALDHAPASASDVAAPSSDLVVQVSGGGTVEGRVTGSDGNSVAGAQVMVMRGMQGQGMRQSRTDGNGDYRIERLPEGGYTVMLVDPQNPMAPSMAQVSVKDGGTARHDFTKKARGGRQVGGAASKDGKPLANAPVMLMGGSAGMKMASTDDKGHFSFDGLEPGDYTVLVQSSFLGSGSASKKVTVGSDGRIDDVRLELTSAKVEGDVVDADGGGVAGAQVALLEAGAKVSTGEDLLGTYRGQAIADERGHFVISDVQAGSFTVKVSAVGYPAATVDGVASGARNVQVQLRRGVDFPVKVTGPDDQPVVNATVQSVDAAGNASMAFDMTMSSITRTDGTATLRLAPGRYTLKVTATDLLPAQVEVDTSSASATVRLDAGATVEVVATTDGTAPAAGARVKVLDASGAEIKPGLTMASFMGGNDRTDAEGRYSRKGLPAGAATVVVTDAADHVVRTDTTLEMNRTRRVDVVVK